MAKNNTSPLAMGRMQKGSAVSKKKKKDEDEKKTVAQKRPQSSSVSKPTQQQRQNQKPYGTTQPKVTQRQPTPRARTATQQRSVDPKETRRQESARTMRSAARSFASEDRRTAAQAQKMNMPTAEQQRKARQATKAVGKAISNSVKESMTDENKARMQRQKSGIQTEEDKRYNEQRNQKRIEVAKNTGRAAKKGVQDTLTGYGKTLADIDEMAKSSDKWTEAKSMKLGIDKDDTAGRAKVEEERQKSIKEARRLRLALGEKQEKRQQEFDEATKNAKGLEKAWYGAVESGTGMATDMAIGAVTGTGQVGALASMGIRSYGTTRGQAEKEGATENEDRLYSLLQAGKEVGTEMMFQGAGLAKSAFSGGKVGLSLADRAANSFTRNMTGRAADATAAGIRLLGGTAEENAEELGGWLLDPAIKEFSYGRNVRQREAKAALKQESDAIRANITSEEDARSAAAYLNSDRFIEENIKQYMDAGLSEKQAREVSEQMRDYLAASLSGDTDRMAELEDSIAATMSGRSLKDWLGEFDKGELADTFASTSLLTLTTGLPAGVSTAARGSAIRDNLGTEGLRALSETAINFEDGVASIKGQAARDRIDEGKELTSTQVYDLAQAQAQQIEKDNKRAQAAGGVADTKIRDENYVTPQLRFGRDGSVAGDEVIAANYVKESNEATDIIEDLLNQEGAESLTDTEVQNGSRAIAGFKTGAFTIADANALNYTNTTVRTAFSEATGVGLDQYVVKDSQGKVDIPKTNAATKDALFAMAADNFVKTAEAETANWMDNVKGEVVTEVTSRMGAQGSVALQAALDDVDERDRSTYMLQANAADMMYQTARNMGTEWDTVKAEAKSMFPGVSEDKLRDMYNAGLRDREAASTRALGKQTKIGETIDLSGEAETPKGNVYIDTEYAPKGSVVRVFSEIATNLGVDIHLVDDLRTGTGTQANGQYINGAIYININSDFEKNVGYIFMHEVTHHLKLYAPEQFNALENLVRERWFDANADEMENEIAKKIDLYKRNGQTLSEEEALEEIIADAAHEFINDSNFARQAAETDPSLAKAILNSIKDALRAIRRILAFSNLDDETHMNTLFSQLGILDEAERLWLDAYTQAVKNRAAVGLVQWDEDARNSVGYHAGDLGKSTVDDCAHQGYGRDSGHFGFGTYFVGDEEQINYGDYGKRKHETVDFDKYNLFRPRNFDQGLKLHDALRLIDGYITDYSEFNQVDRLSGEGIQNSLDNTVRINRAAENLVDDYEWEEYQWNDESLRYKEKVDKYIAEKLDDYDRNEIERKARQRYDEEQNKKVDEESIRKELAHHYDTFKDMKDFWGDPFVSETSEEEYIQNNLEDTIRIRTENKSIPYDYYYYKEAQAAIKGETERWEWKDRKLGNLASDLQFALGFRFSEERIIEALKETEKIVKEYKHNPNYSRLDVEPGLDSGATVFMKQLGYEGVDVRHISEMDNTGYGSVIYDLKGEDLARKQEIGTARFSITPEQDAEYMSAVESGDMKTAQRMVDEAAQQAGYTFGKVYHGTPDNDFTVFNDGIIFFTSNRDTADEYRDPGVMWATRYDKGRTLGAYIKIDNPLMLDNSYSDYRNEHTPWQEWKPTVYGRLPDNAMSATDVAKRAQEEGYDGVFIANDKDTKWSDSAKYLRNRGRGDTVIAFKSNQVKSADPVTYDDNGNVIPLSERFNQDSPDIRYSLPAYTQEEMDAHRAWITDTAEENYGEAYTEDLNESGFIFPDGKLPRMGMYGSRADDHALVVGAYDDIDYATSQKPKAEAMARFLNEGNIRYMPENGSIELGTEVEPTYEQYERIRQMDYVNMIEFTSPDGETVDYKEYDGDRSGVVNDIKRFYRDGEIGGSQLSQFRYSIPAETVEKVEADIGPMVRFSVPTYRTEQPKAIYKSGVGFADYYKDISGRQLTYELTKKNFSKKQADAVVSYMDKMATWFEQTGEGSLSSRFRFIGWNDLTNASVQVKRNDANEIIGVTVSAMVKNGEYPVNFDLTTVCNKREGISNVIKNLMDTSVEGESVLNSIKLTDANMWKINQALKAEGIDTACLGCFVEARRYYAQNFMDKIEDKWNTAVRKARKELGLPENEYFDFAHGRQVTGEEWSSIDSLWTAYDESTESKSSPADRIKILMDEIVRNKDIDSPYLKQIRIADILTPEGINGFKQLSNKGHDMVKTIKSIYGTSAPKEILAFTPYNSEIALLPDQMKGMDTPDYLKSIGGIRVQSFSDFKIEHTFEHFQMVADEAARGFYTHGYSKVIAFPRIFGLTGRKINMSVMFDVLPNRAWAQALGISVRKAAKYAKMYQGLQFVKELPKENKDNRPYREIEIEGVHGYLTYLVSDADYVNSVYDREYAANIEAGMSENEARRAANVAKPFEQSINYREAVELENQEGYKENVGIIAVAYGDEHLKMLLSDPNVRYIIPYHKSGLPTFISKKTALAIARDYTNFQNTNIAQSWKDANGKDVDFKAEYAEFKKNSKAEYPAIEFFKRINDNKYKVKFGSKDSSQKAAMAGTADFDVYEPLETASDIREISNAYLEHCIEKGWCPIFHEFAGDPNYYKMLFDFAVTDGGFKNIYPQRKVKNRYPGLDIDAKAAAGEEITDADLAKLKEEIEKGATTQNNKNMTMANHMGNVMNDILTRGSDNSIIDDTNLQSIRWGTPDYTDVKLGNEEATPEESGEDVRLSISENYDDAYMDAVNSGNMDEAQRLVAEAAERAGYNTPRLYHGTPSFGFTTFDLGRGENIIFATSNPLTAETYSGETDRRNISDAASLNVDDLYGESLLEEVSKYRKKYKDYRLMTPAEQERLLDESRRDVESFARVASAFIDEHKDSFNAEKLEIANRIVNALNRVSTAWADDMVDSAWNDYEDAVWDLKWMDESIQMELTQALQNNGSLLYAKNRVSDFMYAGVIYRNKDYESDYVFDNQLALELDADLHKGIYGLYGKGDNQLVIDANGSNWNQITPPDELDLYGVQRTRVIAEAAKAKGYDSVLFKNLKDNGGGTPYNGISDVYMFFNASQVKSADPVTYAEDGSVIPLSERFDPNNNDIRYSLPTQDADGKVLTDGQMEYFKNSMARDAQGRLVRVYHTTNRGGFTVFDPSYSDDKRSLFFASNFDVSQTYGWNANKPIDIQSKIPTFNSIEDFSAYASENWSDLGWKDAQSFALNTDLQVRDNSSYRTVRSLDRAEEWVKGSADYDRYAAVFKVPNANTGFWDTIMAYSPDNIVDAINKHYQKSERQVGFYQVYLNLENPLIVDAKGHNWNDIPYGPEPEMSFTEYVESLKEKYDEAVTDIAIVQEDYDDYFSLPRAISIRIEKAWKDEFGSWQYGKKLTDSVSINLEDYLVDGDPDPADASIALWQAAEEALSKMGLPKAYIDYLENEESDFEGDIVLTAVDRHFINSETNEFEIADARKYELEHAESSYRTRELAEMAEDMGHDGVIIRNCRDIGGASRLKVGASSMSDIYIAFNSNQVKDINNENPTENPDIRYSITPEDEGMSKLAYEDAMDDSYEALARYEEMLDDPNAEQYFSRPFKEEDVTKFFDSLRAEDAVPSADPSFEEDRVRRAKSKAEFYNSVNAKWNDRWATEGEVLDLKSVKKDIKNLVMGVMANSDTDAQYRNKLVRQTLLDVRTAYQLMKQDRTDVASYLLFHSAQRMIEGVEFIQDDTAFQEYKEIRDYLRTYRINAPEEFWENESFLEFRKEYYGRLRIGKGNSNIEDVYKDLEDRWPHLFNETERENADLKDKPWDLLQHIGVVVDSNVTPFMEAYSSEEAMAVITETADALYDIMAGGKEVVSLADSYKQRFDEKTKAMKQRHAEAILRMRKAKEEGIKKERQKFREYKERQKEKKAHSIYFDRIVKTHKALVDRLVSNTADKNIPEQYKKELANLLAAFDLQTVGSKAREKRTGHKAKNTIKLNAIKDTLRKIEDRTQLFHVSDAITDIMDGLSDIEGKTIDELSATELSNIDKMLRSLLHEFNTYRNVRAGAKKRQAADIGAAQVESDLAHAKKYGRGNDYQGFLGALDKLVNMDEMTPAYLFKRIDPNKQGLGLMYGEIRKSLDTYIRNQNQLNGWMEEIVGKYHQKGVLWNKYGSGELANWRSTNYKQTFNLTNGTVELTPAQMMSLYCLSRRNQAYRHMVGAGIVVAPVSFQAKIMSDIKERANMSLPVILTDADIQTICAALTPEQVNVANQLQELMSTKMADWGNDASMRVLGIELFNETDYFPIKSDKAALEKNLNDQEFVEAIRNFGFTKAVQPGARNAIMVEDIFDVVAEHCNNMNLYNAYSESINDFMKVYNYRHFMEDGSEYTVQQSVAHAYSRKATKFIMSFMRDLNGNVSGRDSGIESLMQSALGNAKKASVFANGRVALQQPTAITRAFAVIDPKYLKGVKVEKGAMQEMFEHCPIALWKSWGYYDINMGRSIEDIMMNNGSWAEDKMTDLYGQLDNVTWTAIWQMVKAEMKDTHPNVEIGSDEYWNLCNERMSEIVDLTQVVDSPLHRSHAMRKKDVLHKLATSFMAEPTLTFNMIKDGYVRSYEAFKAGDKAQAAKIFGRTSSVALIQAAAVASCAAIWDALRGKNPGDDDDDEELSKFRLWWLNTIENFKDETLKPWNKIYIVKDIASIFEGWDNKNLAFQGYQTLYQGLTQMQKKLTKGSKTSWWTINSNIIGGFGYLIGVPFKTVMKDSMSIYKMLGFKSDFVEKMLSEEKTEAVLEIGDGIKPEGLTGKLADFFKEDEEPETTAESAEYSDEDLPDNLTEEQKEEIRKAGERRTKKGVKTSETADRDKNTMLYEAEKAAAGYEGSERDKKIWSSVSQGYKSHIESGDFAYIARMRDVVKQAGGDLDYFDEQINKATKAALKKTIEPGGADTESEMVAQQNMRYYLQSHGVSQEEISAEICYKSDAAKDLKVAFRLGDEQAIIESSYALMWAGITQTDIDRLYKNRNRMDLSKYDGKYKDRLKSTGNFIWPTEGVITSHFGYRTAPTAGASSNHPAIDIGAPQGTAVVAADGGTVIYAGRNSGYGNSVGIKHDNGMVTYYNHLYSWNVNVGDTVGQGQQIAQVGSTGISTGPHLDFKILDTNGEPVDPEQYLQKRQ